MDWKSILAIGAVGLVVLYVVKKQATAAVSAVGTALNPVSQGNIVNQGVNAVLTAVSSTPNIPTSLGSEIYDWLNPEYDPNAPTNSVK